MLKSGQQHDATLQALRRLPDARPATKMGAILSLWSEIEALQKHGHRPKAIWASLVEDGFPMSYDPFRLYLKRARRKIRQFSSPPARPNAGETYSRSLPNGEHAVVFTGRQRHIDTTIAGEADPFAGIRMARTQKAKEQFEYDPLAPLKEDFAEVTAVKG